MSATRSTQLCLILVKEQRIEQHRVGRLLTANYTAALPLAVTHTNEFLQHVLLNELQVYMFFTKTTMTNS